MPKRRLKYLVIFLILVALGLFEAVVLWHRADNLTSQPKRPGPVVMSSGAGLAFNKNLYPLNSASSLWVVVNKGRVLPSTFSPPNLVTPKVALRLGGSSSEMQLRAEAAAALEQMFNEAQREGLNLMLASGYRYYGNQLSTYNGFASKDGQAAADRYSARPGHSEHQTGLAADIEPANRRCELQNCFGDLAEGRWLAANAYKFGFIVRYQ